MTHQTSVLMQCTFITNNSYQNLDPRVRTFLFILLTFLVSHMAELRVFFITRFERREFCALGDKPQCIIVKLAQHKAAIGLLGDEGAIEIGGHLHLHLNKFHGTVRFKKCQ